MYRIIKIQMDLVNFYRIWTLHKHLIKIILKIRPKKLNYRILINKER